MLNYILEACNYIVNKKLIYFILFITIIYCFTAYNSSGFHQPDEHFQIIEFANYKLGNTKPQDLSWEFKAEIRPTIQPALTYLIFTVLDVIQLSNPYTKTLVLRELTAIFAIISIFLFSISMRNKIKNAYFGLFIILSYLLWYIPYISVRFSSEAWSALFMLTAIYCVNNLDNKLNKKITLGIILGLSITFRYQSLLLVLGLFLWMYLIQKVSLRTIVIISFGTLTVMLFGVLVDYWFYGKFVFTIYNYFEANIINDIASTFGVNPWYDYILFIIKDSTYVIGIGILFSLIYVLKIDKKDIIIWITLPYLIVHSIIPHKELRFLFPLAYFSPYLIVYTLQNIEKTKQYFTKIKGIYMYIFFTINTLGLITISTKSAGNGKQAVGDFIFKNHRENKINVIYIGRISSYNDWPFSRNTFYKYPNVSINRRYSIWERDFKIDVDTSSINLLMISNDDFTGKRTELKIKQLGYVLVSESIPKFSQKIVKLYDPDNNDNIKIFQLKYKE